MPGPGGAEAAAPAPRLRRAGSSRFSVLLEGSVDYGAYRRAFQARRVLQQEQPRFDSLDDAEEELRCVLHDDAFARAHADGPVAAENAALAVDWFAAALVGLFSGAEPFEDPGFLRLCCMFFASPLYENNDRLVQRHLVKRAYAELSVEPGDAYEPSLWLLLALLHLVAEFQASTLLLCKDSGLFPLLQALVLAAPERDLHVLAMSLMFEIAQAVELSQADLACATDSLLRFLLDYIERMRYADSDVYNHTATKLVLALSDQLSRQAPPAEPAPQSPLAIVGDDLALLADSAQQSFRRRRRRQRSAGTASAQPMSPRPPSALGGGEPDREPSCEPNRAMPGRGHTRTSSLGRGAGAAVDDSGAPAHPLLLPLLPGAACGGGRGAHALARSQSMELRAQALREDPAAALASLGGRIGAALRLGAPGADAPRAPDERCSAPIIEILAQREDCCKTFTENLVFLLNRETDPATLRLILRALACILASPDTSGILYTNDMRVLTDIVIRDLSDLSDGDQRLRQSYLRVVGALVRNPIYLAARHRLSDIELCLVNLLRQSLISSQAHLAPVGSAGSRRGSMSDSSTRHNSLLSDPRRAASPAPSLSSTASEETCCVRASADEPRAPPPAQKASRRAAPPPPPTLAAAAHIGGPSAPPSPPAAPHVHHRRRPPPPPPPPRSRGSPRSAAHTPTQQLSPVAESPRPDVVGPAPVPRRKIPPPPPPPPRARPASREPHRRPVPPPPPPPPPRTDRARSKPEQTGIRRQLSVKQSVSRYKRNSLIQSRKPAPPPPIGRQPAATASAATSAAAPAGPAPPVSPIAEAETEVEPEAPPSAPRPQSTAASAAHTESEAEDPDPLPDPEHSAEERRATRKLVADALRGCHEARIVASSLARQA
ncbi:hypothetical protein H4R18_000087 [Coemansia javaensis]|uniref:SPIN90/Ldb17 leucine-rich domain-containing protein n=1 Tax=Coemansia javaensis TaxID=2761396 RepID=A0A9W8HPS3_9FUNG|nr:hypothetical protein H4R18_000087 [Coemansia javaensis]